MPQNNQSIVNQLQALINALTHMEDDTLLPALLDVCCGLLSVVDARRPSAAKMDDIDLSVYTGAYADISGAVRRFADDVRSTNCANHLIDQLTDEITVLKEEEQQLRQQLSDVENLLASQHATTDALEQTVKSQQDQLQQLLDFHTTLTNMSLTCTPAIIANQRQTNQTLLNAYTTAQNTLAALQEEEENLKIQQKALADNVTDIQKKIDSVPDENKKLVADYDEKLQLLSRYQNALTECSPEKQNELQKKITDLRPRAETLEAEMDSLRTAYEQLTATKTTLDEEKQELETTLLEYLHRSMGTLFSIMEPHRNALMRIREQAESYSEELAKCQQLKVGYEAWFGVNRNVLDAMLAAIDREEHTNLQQTLSPGTQVELKQQFETARQALDHADRLLQRCTEAVTCDQRAVERVTGAK